MLSIMLTSLRTLSDLGSVYQPVRYHELNLLNSHGLPERHDVEVNFLKDRWPRPLLYPVHNRPRSEDAVQL